MNVRFRSLALRLKRKVKWDKRSRKGTFLVFKLCKKYFFSSNKLPNFSSSLLHLDEAGHRHEQVCHGHGGGCRAPEKITKLFLKKNEVEHLLHENYFGNHPAISN